MKKEKTRLIEESVKIINEECCSEPYMRLCLSNVKNSKKLCNKKYEDVFIKSISNIVNGDVKISNSLDFIIDNKEYKSSDTIKTFLTDLREENYTFFQISKDRLWSLCKVDKEKTIEDKFKKIDRRLSLSGIHVPNDIHIDMYDEECIVRRIMYKFYPGEYSGHIKKIDHKSITVGTTTYNFPTIFSEFLINYKNGNPKRPKIKNANIFYREDEKIVVVTDQRNQDISFFENYHSCVDLEDNSTVEVGMSYYFPSETSFFVNNGKILTLMTKKYKSFEHDMY